MMDKEVFTCVRSHVATAAYDEDKNKQEAFYPVSYTHLRAHET